MTYEMDIAGLKRDLPLCKVTDDLYIGAFVMFGDVELTVHCAAELLKLTPEYDYLIAPEAKAIPLVYEMARQSGADKYFVARKKAKAYMSSVFQVHVKSITTQGVQTLVLDQTDAELIHGKRIVIVDDVISTGESLRAMEELVNEAGGIIAPTSPCSASCRCSTPTARRKRNPDAQDTRALPTQRPRAVFHLGGIIMNLLFAINGGYIPTFLGCMRSVLLHGGASHYEVFILHSDLTDGDEADIRTAQPDVDFHFVFVDPAMFDGFPESKRYPRQIYYRIAAPLLLPDTLERILYLDADTVIINPLTTLYATPFGDAYFMACTHTRKLLEKLNAARLGMDEAAPYINTGVLLYNLPALRADLDMERVRAFADEKQDVFLLPDQDILTALYGDRVHLLDSMVYNLSDRILALHNAELRNAPVDLDWVRAHTVIIHYCGRLKPWKPHYVGVLDVFYHELMEEIQK